MILQYSHLVVDCPVCGRPLEMQPQLIGHEFVCGHCRGGFFVYETDDGSLTAANWVGVDPMKRAEQLLIAMGATDVSASDYHHLRLPSLVSVVDKKWRPGDSHLPSLEEDECKEESQPTTLLVDHRDEVFARIAIDMAESGMRVVRAKSATEALKLCGKYEPALVVANLDLPDQSGWLLAGKLLFVDHNICVWLYQPQSSNYDHELANFLNVDALLDYRGDLLGLSETIVDLMANRREPHNAAHDTERTGQPAEQLFGQQHPRCF
jgi:hypothetical protein